ncbi:MAG: DUF3990 domain-containing protein [Prevotellaceae bacterium]|jgi:hypothetical protein|nr:DUF3990 domain-containing protein [Prevotellaceae bacterium]
MKLYHGSYMKITEIDLSKGERHRDFGKGFYVTKFRHHAEDWAMKIAGKYGNTGFVTEFDFYETYFDDHHYDVLRFDSYSDAWLDFVVMNRDKSHKEPRHGYDFVEGPVADDKIQYRLRQFLRGRIPRDVFLEQLSHHEPTHQICFCTVKSLQTITLSENEPVWNIEDISESLLEALMLDNQIDEAKAADLFYNSNTFAQLEDENSKLNLRPWQEIYKMLKKELKTLNG